jgi:hypothetical protein
MLSFRVWIYGLGLGKQNKKIIGIKEINMKMSDQRHSKLMEPFRVHFVCRR